MSTQEEEIVAAKAKVAARTAARWMESQRQRLEAQREAFSQFPPTLSQFAGASLLPPDALRPADPALLEELGTAPKRGPAAAARLIHRRSQEAVLNTGFEPQRHTVIIEGRPSRSCEGKLICLLQGV